MSRVDDLADLNLGSPGEHKPLGTLLFTVSMVLEFVLQPESWPVFVAWYRQSSPVADQHGRIETDGRAELESMLSLARQIAMAGHR